MIGRWRRRHRPDAEPPEPAEPFGTADGPGRRHRAVLDSRPAGIKLARRITVTVLTGWGLHPRTTVHDAAVLAVTELAANAVRHAAPRSPSFELSLVLSPRHLDVAVRDRHPAPAALPGPGAGGGLAALAELAAELGGALALLPAPDGGKSVRARLALDPVAATGPRPAPATPLEQP
ncbi:ATP-binding protein [Kitasatospora cineracea]|uniref:ATP-binding protein n=1 Tax=Kitasatospora cineracea TaxID=88074 RepID=UPI0038030691